ncbi:TRAP transporter small permease subunit [Atopomonas sediminilitoris]|uniref:TRAP transporter small permease subunit n=1 Tax=Atopomonas sediminilitoris TaxID=2919919 RepID=UPI001F4D7E17|nr:TRAP transporter small permease subunit [Atopomonas sediminilitoris]MCJ8169498.1 TRAP transporter small permease subunit [Atopomonas sediminilitoris]
MSATAPPALLRVAHLINALNHRLGTGCAWLTVPMVLVTAVVVVLRYGFDTGAIAAQESVMYLHALVFMGAAAWTLQRNAHVRVDIFYQKMSPRRRALVDLLGTLLFLLPICLYLGINSWGYVAEAWQVHERSREAGGLAFVYLQKSIILVLVVSLVLQGIAEIIRHGYTVLGLTTEDSQHG